MKPAIPGMVLGFKLQFRPMIIEGSKRHTMRGESTVSRRVGGVCHCWTGLRTKQAELIGRWPCTRTELVEVMLESGDVFSVAIQQTRLRWDELISFAFADGFRFDAGHKRLEGDVLAMKNFWMKNNGLGKTTRLWTGRLIHWDYEHPVAKDGTPLGKGRKAAK